MSTKWKLFGIVSYLVALFFLVIIVFAIKAFLNPASGMRHLEGAKLITLSIFVIFLNAVFNIYIFHRHLPSNPPGKQLKKFYIFSLLLCTVAFGCISFFVVPDVIDEIGSGGFYLWPITLALLFTLFILIAQYSVLKHIDKKFALRVNNQIEELGNDQIEYH